MELDLGSIITLAISILSFFLYMLCTEAEIQKFFSSTADLD